MNEEGRPKLPMHCRCAICHEKVTEGDRFIWSKPRRGGLIVAHAECWEREQQEIKKASKRE